MKTVLTQLLAVPTPTFKEKECADFVQNWLIETCNGLQIKRIGNSIIANYPFVEGKPHISLIGHLDVVPAHIVPFEKNGNLYGSGASDMKAADAVFMTILKSLQSKENLPYNISVVFYDKEEGTAITDNGLYDLIQSERLFFESIDCAIVGEPTNSTIQIGCVGSIHAIATVNGKASHSARPWDGENALYKALPFMQAIAAIEPKKEPLFGVDFYDVVDITEATAETGRTSVPGYWTCNVNFRFSPVWEEKKAQTYLHKLLLDSGACEVTIKDSVYAGKVIESPLFKSLVKKIGAKVEAKQAWTDVAQLTQLGVAAFNFGPGLTGQAHKVDEYVVIADVDAYYKQLLAVLTA